MTKIRNNTLYLFLIIGSHIFSYSGSWKQTYTTLFAHGLGGNQNQAYYYTGDYSSDYIIKNNYKTFNFPDAQAGFNRRKQVNLGQEKDIETLEYEHYKIIEQDEKTILFGVSRGAATVINYAATVGIKAKNNIPAIILESPFDHIKSIVRNKLQSSKLDYDSSVSLGTLVVKALYPGYNRKGIHPIDVVAQLPRDIPIIFIHSQKDSLIPIESSLRLYKKLVEAGHQHAYFIETKHGAHANILWSRHGYKYKNSVHAILKKYGLPCKNSFAQDGAELLSELQPTIEQVNEKLKISPPWYKRIYHYIRKK